MSQDENSLSSLTGRSNSTRSTSLPTWLRILRATAFTAIWFALGLFILWATFALYFDLRIESLRLPLALIYIFGIVAILIMLRGSSWAATLCLFSCFCVLLWWLTLKPTNSGTWQPNVDRTAWVEVDGDRVTIHNLRNCDYRNETDYSNCWSDRIVYLSQLKAADFFLTNWGLSFASHPIVSFHLARTTISPFRLRRATDLARNTRQSMDFIANLGLSSWWLTSVI